jgi:hypothetical protein
MEPLRLCATCGKDISARMHPAKYCYECGQPCKVKIQKAKKQRTHKPKPTSCIRAITPVKSELGTSTTKTVTRKEDRIREITPSPILSEQQFRLNPNKKTWVFPKTEKRYKELLNGK